MSRAGGQAVIRYHGAAEDAMSRGDAVSRLRGAYPVDVTAARGGDAFTVTVRPLGGPVGRLQAGVQCQAPPAAIVPPAAARVWAAALAAAADLAERVSKPTRDPGK